MSPPFAGNNDFASKMSPLFPYSHSSSNYFSSGASADLFCNYKSKMQEDFSNEAGIGEKEEVVSESPYGIPFVKKS